MMIAIGITRTTTPNWSDLPFELLHLILTRLTLVHIAVFRLVSSSWNTAAKSYLSSPIYKPLVPHTPWLLLPQEHGSHHDDDGRFFSLSEKRIYTFTNLFQGFAKTERLLTYSSHGWLVMWDYQARRIHLLNPITKVRIKLPGYGSRITESNKVVLSSEPSRHNSFYVVAGCTEIADKSLHGRLKFYKHGGDRTTWSDLNTVEGKIVFHNGLLFVFSLLHDPKSITVWAFGGSRPFKTMEFQPPTREFQPVGIYHRRYYIVESLGEFLLVERRMVDQASHLFNYDIHKLKFTGTPNKVEYLKVESLQERVLVLSERRIGINVIIHRGFSRT